jgi:hypothetical protein
MNQERELQWVELSTICGGTCHHCSFDFDGPDQQKGGQTGHSTVLIPTLQLWKNLDRIF